MKGKIHFHFFLGPLNNENSGQNGVSSNSTFSRIDLGKCEDILRENNGIDPNKSLIILISEKLVNNATERNTQFEVYNPDTLAPLNLSECKDEPITI